MKNKRILAAAAVGLLSACSSFYLLYQKASQLQSRSAPVQVLFAARYIPPGSALGPGLVEKREVPEAYVSPSAVHDLREVEGSLNLSPISAGEQILANKFAPSDNSLAPTLNPGFRAYTIEVNETSGVGGLLRPGNRVDILVRTEWEKKLVTAFVFQDLQVLAVGQRTEWKGSGEDTGERGPGYSTVTLAVTPDQAEVLMHLEGRALKLLLRPPGEDRILSLPPQSEQEAFSRWGRGAGTRAKPGTE